MSRCPKPPQLPPLDPRPSRHQHPLPVSHRHSRFLPSRHRSRYWHRSKRHLPPPRLLALPDLALRLHWYSFSLNPSQLFHVTRNLTDADTDPHSLTFARQNIAQNNLSNRIRLLQTEPDGPLLPLDDLGLDTIDFTLTNPPFFTSSSDLLASATLKSRPPSSVCTGAQSEMVSPGGETAFVARMIAESVPLGQRVRWFTAQLGKLGSVATVVAELKKAGVKNWALGELVQGRTKRWVVGWSRGGWRPAVRVARGAVGVTGADLPFPSEAVAVKVVVEAGEVGRRVNEAVAGLGGSGSGMRIVGWE
ncbi:hypothetical protein GMDG_06583 [Pseudogymnoascus destructans 20631-21]|uniref:Uncharacterized protein n=1 Tax=Pseudogymnoascus destructans (strain ATCC MYA-4855 / 20631-21) TaxID=658429 RepID=L8FWG4_PSED2|nr:hypothetical protein GMDG_06583 [Pseudogymnoascus destructans 20631-21]